MSSLHKLMALLLVHVATCPYAYSQGESGSHLAAEQRAAFINVLKAHGNELDAHSLRFEEIFARLSQFHFTACHLDKLLTAKFQHIDAVNNKVLAFLDETVQEQAVFVDTLYRSFAQRIGSNPADRTPLNDELRSLVIRVAANERFISEEGEPLRDLRAAFTHLQEKTLPEVHSMLQSNQQRVDRMELAIRMTNFEYQNKYLSLCERLDRLQNQVIVLQDALGIESAPTPVPDPISGGDGSVDGRFSVRRPDYRTPTVSYTFDLITPRADRVCPGAELLHRCYDLNRTIRAQNGSTAPYSRHGDVYRNCNGEIILLTHTKRD